MWKSNINLTKLTTIKQLLFLCFASSLLVSCSSTSTVSWTELVNQGNDAQKKGDMAAAEESYTKAFNQTEKQFGLEDGRTATCLGYLAGLYRSGQEWRKAAKVYKQLISIKEKLEPDSSDLTQTKSEYKFVKKKLKEYGLSEEEDLNQEKESK